MAETQENQIAHQNGQRLHLKYHLQLKTKDVEWREDSYGGLPRRAVDKGEVCYADLNGCLLH